MGSDAILAEMWPLLNALVEHSWAGAEWVSIHNGRSVWGVYFFFFSGTRSIDGMVW
jgi:urocanate hydratase